jgi:hypothetical protein
MRIGIEAFLASKFLYRSLFATLEMLLVCACEMCQQDFLLRHLFHRHMKLRADLACVNNVRLDKTQFPHAHSNNNRMKPNVKGLILIEAHTQKGSENSKSIIDNW